MSHPEASETFLLMVDMQPVFFPVLAGADGVVKRCTLALESARGLGLGIGFTDRKSTRLNSSHT